MRELEEIVLTFPDGRLVGPGDLEEWLKAVTDSPDTTEDDIEIARAIVARIRALSN